MAASKHTSTAPRLARAKDAWLNYDELTYDEWEEANSALADDERQTELERRANAAKFGRYDLFRLPKAIPDGAMLTHNRVRQQPILGDNGFRAWLEPAGTEDREVCPCGWSPGLPVHYRVASIARR